MKTSYSVVKNTGKLNKRMGPSKNTAHIKFLLKVLYNLTYYYRCRCSFRNYYRMEGKYDRDIVTHRPIA